MNIKKLNMNKSHITLILLLIGSLIFLNSPQSHARIRLAGTSVVINEIHYNPSSLQGTDASYEFAEIYNNGSTAVDLTGWTLGPAALSGSIAIGGYLIVQQGVTYDGLASGTCIVISSAGYFGLSNGGNTLDLNDGSSVVDTVTYDDAAPWPITPDGGSLSLSLEKLLPGLTNDAENWGPSLTTGGSPCDVNTAVAETKIAGSTHSPWTPTPGATVKYEVKVTDPINTVTSVNVTISSDGFTTNTTHAMSDANSDGTWEFSLATGSTADTTYTYEFEAGNNLGARVTSWNAFMNFTTMATHPYVSAFHSSVNNQASEFVVITNPFGAAVDVSGWFLTDEGFAGNFFGSIGSFDTAWKFPAASSIASGASIFIAANGTDFEASFGFVADYEMNGTSTAPNMDKVLGGDDVFEIYKGGEEILLISPDAVIDAVMYSDWTGTIFDGDSFMTPYSSTQTDDTFHRIEVDTDNPATDASQEKMPFIMVTNSVNGTEYDGGETLDLTIFDFGGINSSAYNWDGATNTTASGAATSTTVPTTAGAHVLNLYANDSVGNWVHVKYSFTVAEPPTSSSSSTSTTTTPTTTTTTTTTDPPASSSSSKDDSDDGFIPGFGVWMFIFSITGLMVVRRRYNK